MKSWARAPTSTGTARRHLGTDMDLVGLGRFSSPQLARSERNSGALSCPRLCRHHCHCARQQFIVRNPNTAWDRLLAHDSRRRLRHRRLRTQRSFGCRYRQRWLRRPLHLPTRRPAQPALSQSWRWKLRRHHRTFGSGHPRKYLLRAVRRLQQRRPPGRDPGANQWTTIVPERRRQ